MSILGDNDEEVTIATIVVLVLITIGVFLVKAVIVAELWNYTVPKVFSRKRLPFMRWPTALAMCIILDLLF